MNTNTIEFKHDGHVMVFSTKSLTMDGSEYVFREMKSIRHSAEKHVYVFKYDEKWHTLRYDEKDAAKLSIIFSRIVKVSNAHQAREQAQAADSAPEKSEQPPKEESVEVKKEGKSDKADSGSETDVVSKSAIEESLAHTDENSYETVLPSEEDKPVLSATVFGSDLLSKSTIEASLAKIKEEAETAAESSEEVVEDADKPAGDAADAEAVNSEEGEHGDNTEAAETAETTETSPESLPEVEITEVDSDMKSTETTAKFKLKKSLIILAAVLVFFAILGIGYYKLFGSSDSPNFGPTTDQTNQYNDIDELINDLQE